MARVTPAVELLPVPARGRRFTATQKVRLADVDTRASMRLDAVARYLQDVATDDADDCGLDSSVGWVVRRTMIDVRTPARLGDEIELTTFCTGFGRSWAERRTSLVGEGGASIEAVSLWIQVDLERGRPAPLGAGFHEIYGEAAAGRQVSTRLSLGPPAGVDDRRSWQVRRVDLDPWNHVNNAVQWAALEQLTAVRRSSRRGTAEIEFLVPIDPDAELELRSSTAADDVLGWLVGGDTVHTAARWRSHEPGGTPSV